MNTKTIYLIEDRDCNYCTFDKFNDAIKYALDLIEDSVNDEGDKKEMYKELIFSIADREVDTWGMGFSIDEFLWCWPIDHYTKYGPVTKE